MSTGSPHPEAETGGLLQGDAPVLAAGCSVEPRTGVAAGGKAHDGTEALSGDTWAAVEALAALLEPEAFDDSAPWKSDVTREEYRQRALTHAASAITVGYRRVAVDDDTIGRLAVAIADVSAPTAGPVDPREYYRRAARAVVRALREET